jgi:phosphoribosylformylglycinamidine synthase
VYERPIERPLDQDALVEHDGAGLPRPRDGAELRGTLLRLAASQNLADKSWVTDQYDRYVLGNTVLAPPHDAGMIRLDDSTSRGVAVATDGNGRYARLDPYAGARLALAEAYRNVAVTGAKPIAVTNCLNFGSPEDPGVMWQFAEAVRGLADGCRELGTPVTGGNVSFYNQTGSTAILPTPVVGVLGVIDDVRRRLPSAFLGGRPPAVDFARERALAALLQAAGTEGLLESAHDLSEGGLAQALVECCLGHDIGARVDLPPDVPPFVALFSESTGRAIVSLPPTDEDRFLELSGAHGVPSTRLGVLDVLDPVLEVRGQFRVPLRDVRRVWSSTLPNRFEP